MPELPEVQAHAERLTAQFSGDELVKFVPMNFTALKTALPRPDAAYGLPLETVGRRGKYLQLRFEPVTPFTARICLEQVEHRGVIFPAGTIVAVCAERANRSESMDDVEFRAAGIALGLARR